MMAALRGCPGGLDLPRRNRLDFGAGGAEIEGVVEVEADHAGEQCDRHLLDAGVVFLDRVVEEAAAGRDLVLEVGQLAGQLLEVGVGLQVGIGLRQRDQPAERDAQLVFGGRDLCWSLRRHRTVAGFYPLIERAALVRGVALHGLDQIGDQVVALFELHVDVGKGLADTLTERNQPVIRAEREENDNNEDADNDPARGHDHSLLMRRPPRSLDERWARVRGPRQGGRLGWSLRERGKFNERTRLDYDSYVSRTRCSASSAVHRGAGTGCSRTAVCNYGLAMCPGPVRQPSPLVSPGGLAVLQV